VQAIRRLSTRTVYENRWISVREDEVQRPDGSIGTYGVVDKPDFALVIPAERGGFHLVEQYRYAVAARSWGFPQGTLPDRRTGDPAELAGSSSPRRPGCAPRASSTSATCTRGPATAARG
jgi:hypothetical protein